MKPNFLPDGPFMAAWKDNPLDASVPLILADYLEDQGDGERAHLLRELTLASRSLRRAKDAPSNWEESIEALPSAWRSVFAIGCASRCVLWVPRAYQQEQQKDQAELLGDLTIEPFADAAWSRAYAAWSRAYAAEGRWQWQWLQTLLRVLGVRHG